MPLSDVSLFEDRSTVCNRVQWCSADGVADEREACASAGAVPSPSPPCDGSPPSGGPSDRIDASPLCARYSSWGACG